MYIVKPKEQLSTEEAATRLAAIKMEWHSQPFTSVFIKHLEKVRDELRTTAENLSVSSPVNTDMLQTKLAQAKQITEILNYVNK